MIEFPGKFRIGRNEIFRFLDIHPNLFPLFLFIEMVELEFIGVLVVLMVVVADQFVSAHANGAFKSGAVGKMPNHGVPHLPLPVLDQIRITGIFEQKIA